MSTKISAREVLLHLNELGYKNISADQLREFIKDLKKLMKYENRRTTGTQVIKVNILHDSTDDIIVAPSTGLNNCEKLGASTIKSINNTLPISPPEISSNESKHTSSIVLPKCFPKPTTVNSTPSMCSTNKTISEVMNESESMSNSGTACPLHSFKAPDADIHLECSCPINASSQVSSSILRTSSKRKKRVTVDSGPSSSNDKLHLQKNCTPRKRTKKQTGVGKCQHDFTHPCYFPESLRPRSAVIKCNIASNSQYKKCDPVNLYKYYERQWKINKIPGENRENEQKFRWCCRERISCGPPVSLRKPLKKKYDIVLPSIWP